MGFVHLHLHTEYSVLDGLGKIDSYIQRAKDIGQNAIAITDHGNMFGALTFYKHCNAAGIKPIIGMEAYVAGRGHSLEEKSDWRDKLSGHRERLYHHLVLLCKDAEGYKNLSKLSSIGWVEGFYMRPRIDQEVLQRHSKGLVCLSACLAGEIPQLILAGKIAEAKEAALWYKGVFGPDYYLEVQSHGIAGELQVTREVLKIAQETGIKVVATNDCHYVREEDSFAHKVLVCLGQGKKITDIDPDNWAYPDKQFYMRSEEEMLKLFPQCPEAITNTEEVAAKCNIQLDLPGPLPPNYPQPEGFATQADYLTHLAKEGFIQRYGVNADKSYSERLDYELGVIIEMNFPGYFLIVADYVNWAKEHDIPVGYGRGSGAGSIVAYCLKITNVDPMRYGLMFERFLNPERKSMPDFDIDFCTNGRERVVEYVRDKYGHDKVAQICSFGRMQVKNAIKDVGRVLDVPLRETERLCKVVANHQTTYNVMTLSFKQLLNGFVKDNGEMVGPCADLVSAYDQGDKQAPKKDANAGQVQLGDIPYKTLFDTCQILENNVRSVSLHPAGVVIGQKDLFDYGPLYFDSKSQTLATQYEMRDIEECGLVKMDFLGLKTLTVMDKTIKMVKRKEPDFALEKIPEDDEEVFRAFGEGDTDNIFQFESSGMKNYMSQLKPHAISELTAMNALYRPGPIDNIPQYIESKNDPTKIKYPDPVLEDILKETYGVIVYQEQVMNIARVYSGFSLGQADILRKIMGKKQKDKLPAEKQKFIDGAVAKGHSQKDAEALFTLLEPFAGYGFNKSHAVCYAVLAYQTMYLKTHYPAEFIAATLSIENDPDKFNTTIRRTQKMGLKVKLPDINKSYTEFTVDSGNVIYGLEEIKSVGSIAANQIVVEREKNGPYKSIGDFVLRLDNKTTNARVVGALIDAGAFDCFGYSRKALTACLTRLTSWADGVRKQRESGQLNFFDFFEEGGESTEKDFEIPPEVAREQDSQLETLQKEFDVLGNFISAHPLDEYPFLLERKGFTTIAALETENEEGKDKDGAGRTRLHFLAAYVIAINYRTSKKNGAAWAQITLNDKTGTMEINCWPTMWDKIKDFLTDKKVFVFSLRSRRNDASEIQIDSVLSPEEARHYRTEKLEIFCKSCFEAGKEQALTQDDVKKISQILYTQGEGTIPVYVHTAPNEIIKMQQKAVFRPDLCALLSELECVEKAVLV